MVFISLFSYETTLKNHKTAQIVQRQYRIGTNLIIQSFRIFSELDQGFLNGNLRSLNNPLPMFKSSFVPSNQSISNRELISVF